MNATAPVNDTAELDRLDWIPGGSTSVMPPPGISLDEEEEREESVPGAQLPLHMPGFWERLRRGTPVASRTGTH